MVRKKREEEHENHERWLVSYADFITLLFAFFVVMYAISSVNEAKYRALSKSFITAFGKEASNTPSLIDSNSPHATSLSPAALTIDKKQLIEASMLREKEKMKLMADNLLKSLAPLIKEGKVRVMQTVRGVSVEINNSALFASADAKLNDVSSKTLELVAGVLKNDTHKIEVEGHTDSNPISSEIFPSNWELSSARASSVVRLFIDNGVEGNRMLAIGRAETQPIDSNETDDGRQRNRRVQLCILAELPPHD